MRANVAIELNDSANPPSSNATSASSWRAIFMHRAAVFCLLLVLLHQGIVASSTIFLAETIEKFQSHQDYFTDLCLYLTAMAIPYLPGCASLLIMQRWINEAHDALVGNFAAATTSKNLNYRDQTTRDHVTAVLSRNSYPVIKDYIVFLHDLASFGLNSLLSILVIVFLLPPQLAGGYCISLALCFLIIIRLRKSVAKASSRSEYAYLQYSGVLAVFWPNTALGNEYNQTIWHKQRGSVGRAFYTASNRLEALRQSGNVLLAAASLGPTIFLIVIIASSEARDPAVIAALIVSLTRIFLIVNSLSTLVHRVLDYSSLHARVRVLLDAHTSLTDRAGDVINASVNICVNGVPVCDIDQGKQLISRNRQGRFTVTGSNGSGKSTFLFSLKQQYGATCFLLPSNYFDLSWEKDCRSLSTGQRLIEHLIEIFRIETITHIVLDEWDANLDVDNTRKIDEILHTLSTKKVIIEVRHKRS